MNEKENQQITSLFSPAKTKRLGEADQQRLLNMLKAISHPMRFEILQFLIAHPHCYTKEVVDHLPISQATVSQHIKQLREAGWLSSEAVCQMTYHWLDVSNIEWFKDTIGDIF
ncbi:MAG: metalloregulator ArsR/SmtB family transcription factor [Chloroflexota bacterium]